MIKRTLCYAYSFGLLMLPLSLFAATDAYYCPENHAYINVGMTAEQVLNACGQPLSQQDSKEPFTQKIPVLQLIYNDAGTATAYNGIWRVPGTGGSGAGSAFYRVWNIPSGGNGVQMEVDVVNQQVQALKINGGGTNSISFCGGANIQQGDPVQKVYSACGSPSVVNNTFMKQIVPTVGRPKVWIYQPSPYQPSVTMTFVNGRLQSIQ